MIRPLAFTLALFGPAALSVAACTTDSPKSGGAGDAGSPPEIAAVVDAGTVAPAVIDAGAPATVDAGTVTAVVVDAGTAEVRPTSTDPPANDGRPKQDFVASAFDKILAKPKDANANPEELKAIVEKKTGQKVVLVRRTAGKWYMFQFAPKPGGRDADDQKKLVDKMKDIDAFASVEADRLMKVKVQ